MAHLSHSQSRAIKCSPLTSFVPAIDLNLSRDAAKTGNQLVRKTSVLQPGRLFERLASVTEIKTLCRY